MRRTKEILDAVALKNDIVKVGDSCCLEPIPSLLTYHHIYSEIKPEDLEAARLYQQFFIKEG